MIFARHDPSGITRSRRADVPSKSMPVTRLTADHFQNAVPAPVPMLYVAARFGHAPHDASVPGHISTGCSHESGSSVVDSHRKSWISARGQSKNPGIRLFAPRSPSREPTAPATLKSGDKPSSAAQRQQYPEPFVPTSGSRYGDDGAAGLLGTSRPTALYTAARMKIRSVARQPRPWPSQAMRTDDVLSVVGQRSMTDS